jgi:YD repeat-containing protein
MTYDSAARPLGDEETSTADISLPKVTNEYGTETGAMIKQSTTTGETTRTVTGAYNTLGELESYTDADANTSKYTYDIDGRVEEMSDGKGTQSYAYDGTTGVLSKLLDSAAGTFTAGYDVDGKLTSETYPNGMTVKYTDDSTGHATHEEYVKETHCSENCTWFGEGVTYSIHGEALSRASTLAKEEYAYDAAGRLLQVQETSSGKGCTTRLYAYDEDSNRTSLTTREPEAGGKCATTGGTTEAHTYDEADRLNDTGIAYDALGNTTKVPAADAGKAELTSTYYVDNQTASQKQNEETINYGYDPSGRTRETISEGSTKATVIDHYAGPGEAISWISEGPEKWTRNIPGIDGALTATQANGQPAVLQVHDLQGNIVATAAISETETKVLTTYNSTEFGVPVNGTPPTKYSWLGATGLVPETPTGTTVSGGDGYVPQLGRALQTQPVIPPGAFPDGSYNGAPYTTTLEPWVLQSMNTWGAAGPEREASRLTAAREKAEEEANLRQCNQATMCPTPTEGGAEGGNGPGEETFGDPIKCYAGGTVVSSNEEATIAGYGGCNRGLPAGTWIKICVYDWPDSSPYPTGGCSKTIQVKGHTSRYWSMGTTFTARCSEGDIIRGYIAFWVPGGRTLYAGTEQGECGGGDESVWEALTPWQALPGDLG